MFRIVQRSCRPFIMFKFTNQLRTGNCSVQLLIHRIKSFSTITSKDYERHFNKKQAAPNHFDSSDNIKDLLAKIPNELDELSAEEVLGDLKSLSNFNIPKNKELLPKLLNHSKFLTFCNSIQLIANQFTVEQSIDALYSLQVLDTPIDTKICAKLFKLIQKNIADIPLQKTIILAKLLERFRQHTNLSHAIQLALPLLFQTQLLDQLPHLNVKQKVEALFYTQSYEIIFPDRSEAFAIVLNSLSECIEDIQPYIAKHIICCLCQIDGRIYGGDLMKYKEIDEFLLKLIDLLTKHLNSISTEEAFYVLKRYSNKCAKRDSIFNENFLDAIASHVIKSKISLREAIDVQHKLNKVGYENPIVCNYMSDLIETDPNCASSLKSTEITNLMNCFAFNNFKPLNWNTIIWPVIENSELFQNRNNEKYWFRAALELISLDHCHAPLLCEILSSAYLDQFFASKCNRTTENYVRLWHIYQFVSLNPDKFSQGNIFVVNEHIQKGIALKLNWKDRYLQPYLEQELGKEKVLSKIQSKYGHAIQHIVKYNLDSKEFVAIENVQVDFEGFVHLEEIACAENERLIAVDTLGKRCFNPHTSGLRGVSKMHKESLHRLGLISVLLNTENWRRLPDDSSKSTYILDKIKESILQQI